MTEETSWTDAPEQRADDLQCYCQFDGVIDLLARKYAIQVLCLVGAIEPARYAEIEATLGDVSSSTLSTRLADLTEAGVLRRERYEEIPPRVEYSLTDDGEELCELLEPLLRWAHSRETDGQPADRQPADGQPPHD